MTLKEYICPKTILKIFNFFPHKTLSIFFTAFLILRLAEFTLEIKRYRALIQNIKQFIFKKAIYNTLHLAKERQTKIHQKSDLSLNIVSILYLHN